MTTTQSTHGSKTPKPLVIKHWMSASPHSVGREQPLSVAHRAMREHGLRHLPVLEHGKLVGIVSQRDLYFLESIQGVDLDTDRVEDAMSQEVYTVPAESRLEDVIPEMHARKYGCVVVADADKVVGVFTTTDALEVLIELLPKRR
jgi:acetoin utilization protein AcuB